MNVSFWLGKCQIDIIEKLAPTPLRRIQDQQPSIVCTLPRFVPRHYFTHIFDDLYTSQLTAEVHQ